MKYYVGIDLGTTNSAICLYDGAEVRICRSPEQNDVTPSAIYVDRRGRRYYGRRAYEMAPANEQNSATLFKRYLGTGKRFTFEAAGVEMSPEECSAEILRVLYGYLPEEVRSDPETATVITVPASFSQVKKDATLEAARLAGIGRVALMQEPVAAIMSVMRKEQGEAIFLIYDLGGGTFDISVARSAGNRVSLLTQGGREMCGGRDWDRMIYRHVVEPWLKARFTISSEEVLRRVRRLALLAVEQAKIELSSCEESAIRMDEDRMGAADDNGKEIYLDIPLTRAKLNTLINAQLDETIETTREALQKAGLQPSDVTELVFVGGPSSYQPLRDKVSIALGIPAGAQVNPMTAVAEGAAIYAESVDWQDSGHLRRKEGVTSLGTTGGLTVRYEARTTREVGRVAFAAEEGAEEMSVELVSEDTGWVSGRTPVRGRLVIEAPLPNRGENHFRLSLFDVQGQSVPLNQDRLVITRAVATISAIPAAFPIAIKALDKVGGKPVPVYLVEENDPLPKRGSISLRAGVSLAAGSDKALVFTLWEGGIKDPIEENRYIGTYRIPGNSIYSGVVPVGAEIICDYELNESGTLYLGVSIPCVGVNLSEKNFYSRTEGQLNMEDAPKLLRESKRVMQRLAVFIAAGVRDDDIGWIHRAAQQAREDAELVDDYEALQEASDRLVECRRRLARLRQKYQGKVLAVDLARMEAAFNRERPQATEQEISEYDNLVETAKNAIEAGEDARFRQQLDWIQRLINRIRWRQDDIIRDYFQYLALNPQLFHDRAAFDRLRAEGLTVLNAEDMKALRDVVVRLNILKAQTGSDGDGGDGGDDGESMFEDVNVTRS